MPRPSNPPFVFDNDCLSSFLWVKQLDLLCSLLQNKVLVPEPVEVELKYLRNTRHAWVYFDFQESVLTKKIRVVPLVVGSPVADEYLALKSGQRHKALGSGEAAALAWVRYNGGTVASNNLADVLQYCRTHKLPLITTEDILCTACLSGLVNVKEGTAIWDGMKARKRKLPKYSFTESLERFCQSLE